MDEIDKRIIWIIDLLIFLKKTESATMFAESVKLGRQTITNIKGGSQHFTATHIYNICQVYNINANCIFGFEKTVFNNDKNTTIPSF